MLCTILMMIIMYLITETPDLKLVLMIEIQFKYYFEKVDKIYKEGFNEILPIEVEEKDKEAIFEAAKKRLIRLWFFHKSTRKKRLWSQKVSRRLLKLKKFLVSSNVYSLRGVSGLLFLKSMYFLWMKD